MVVQEEEGGGRREEIQEDEQGMEVGKMIDLSINSVVSLTSPRTMKLTGNILGHPVLVMIDCGATHNFISAELASQLALPITRTASYGVLIGTGLSIRGRRDLKGSNSISAKHRCRGRFPSTAVGMCGQVAGNVRPDVGELEYIDNEFCN